MAQYSKQLRAFYKKQGLQGRHLRSALKYDRRRVREEADVDRFADFSWLGCLFLFEEAREGGAYWHERSAA